MVERSELLRVPAFVDLPEDQIDWFLGHAEELHLKAGNAPFRQGDPADAMFVILEGQLQAYGEFGGETGVLDQARRRDRRFAFLENEAVYGGCARCHGRKDPTFS